MVLSFNGQEVRNDNFKSKKLYSKHLRTLENSFSKKPNVNDFKNYPHSKEFLVDSKDINPVAVVAIMGRPNVGKSSLFNRLNKQNIAITHHMSGSTRDINKKDLRLNKFDITLVDTGGLELDFNALKNIDNISQYAEKPQINTKNKTKQDIKKEVLLKKKISIQSYSILKECDLILYLVDGQNPPDEEDIKIFRELSSRRPTILVINKVDNDRQKIFVDSEFHIFGVESICICVSHNRFITQLLTKVESKIRYLMEKDLLKERKRDSLKSITCDSNFENYESIEFNEFDEIKNTNEFNLNLNDSEDSINLESKNINIGIIGRPNVGKSSFLNAMVGKNRSLVSNLAGTTIDPVDEQISYRDYKFTFVDTAGIRARGKISGIEKYALMRTKEVLKCVQIAIIILDASTDLVEMDEKICSEAFNNHLGVIILLNKWDIRKDSFESHMSEYRRKFRFLEYAPVITISSSTLKRIKSVKDEIINVYRNFHFRITTAKLNLLIAKIIARHPMPSDHGKLVKVYYATQIRSAPIEIALVMNRPKSLHFSYKRYLINSIRKEFNLNGVPILIKAIGKNDKK